MQVHFDCMVTANPTGPDPHPSEEGNPMISPAWDHRIAETPHLVEQTFEETLAATHGLVMVDFWARGVARAAPSRRCSTSWPWKAGWSY